MRRHRVGRLSRAPRLAARPHRRAAPGVAREHLNSAVLQRPRRGRTSPSTRFAPTRCAPALTIMGVAIGVFVVVALSSVVHGINESFARDIEAAGPTSFFVYRRPIGGFQACDGTDETCPERRNPAITMEEVRMLERLPTIRVSHGTRRHRRARSATRTGSSTPGIEAYSRQLDGRRRRGHLSRGGASRAPSTTRAARVVIVNDEAGAATLRRVRPARQADHHRRRPVHGHRHLPLHGEPYGNADVGRGWRRPEGDHPVETARTH